jgi:large subunit ribosomal protein L21e
VDIKGCGAVQKGLPHKFYHGKTGIVFNVTPRAIGVELNKLHRNRIIKKRIHVRVEHLHRSRSREDFLKRVVQNELRKKEAKKSGKTIVVKRMPVGPRPATFVRGTKVETLTPLAYVGLYQ